MPVKYLLPCSCGAKITIDVGKAGRTVRCQCGRKVEVPTMREIKKLRQFQERQIDSASDWSPRLAVALAGAVLAVVATLAAGWLWLNRPVSPQGKIESEIRSNLERLEENSFRERRKIDRSVANMTTIEAYKRWQKLRKEGLFWLEQQQAGTLTARQQIERRFQQDRRLVEYRKQEQHNTNFCYIALAAGFVGVAICVAALFFGRRTAAASS